MPQSAKGRRADSQDLGPPFPKDSPPSFFLSVGADWPGFGLRDRDGPHVPGAGPLAAPHEALELQLGAERFS